MATEETLGEFLNGLRIVVIDGTCFDVPDSDENARVFGRPSSRPGTVAAFPKVRLVILSTETEIITQPFKKIPRLQQISPIEKQALRGKIPPQTLRGCVIIYSHPLSRSRNTHNI
jgi:hypothetical protein